MQIVFIRNMFHTRTCMLNNRQGFKSRGVGTIYIFFLPFILSYRFLFHILNNFVWGANARPTIFVKRETLYCAICCPKILILEDNFCHVLVCCYSTTRKGLLIHLIRNGRIGASLSDFCLIDC